MTPQPHDVLVDEGGVPIAWLASAWTERDVRDEYFWLFETDDGEPISTQLRECWYAVRWTTPEERADEDWLLDQFGSDWDSFDVTTLYDTCSSDHPDAVRYLTID